jgi:hypothetical protein
VFFFPGDSPFALPNVVATGGDALVVDEVRAVLPCDGALASCGNAAEACVELLGDVAVDD